MFNKRVVLLTELYNTILYDNIPELEPYHMLIYIYEPYTYIATHRIHENDICEILYNDNNYIDINETIQLHKNFYKKNNQNITLNSSISNYNNIINKSNYIVPEIGYVIKLANNICAVVKTTCWLKIFQRKIRNILKKTKIK